MDLSPQGSPLHLPISVQAPPNLLAIGRKYGVVAATARSDVDVVTLSTGEVARKQLQVEPFRVAINENTMVAIDAAGRRLEVVDFEVQRDEVIALPVSPTAVAIDDRSIVVADVAGHELVWIDRSSGAVTARTHTPGAPLALSMADGLTATITSMPASLTVLDGNANVLATTRLTDRPRALLGLPNVWAIAAEHSVLVVGRTGTIKRLAAGRGADYLTATDDYLMLGMRDDERVGIYQLTKVLRGS